MSVRKRSLSSIPSSGCRSIWYRNPEIDAELIILTARLWKALGIDQHVSLQLNSIGSLEARANYRSALVAFLENHQDLMSDEEKERLVKIHYVFWILKIKHYKMYWTAHQNYWII